MKVVNLVCIRFIECDIIIITFKVLSRALFQVVEVNEKHLARFVCISLLRASGISIRMRSSENRVNF